MCQLLIPTWNPRSARVGEKLLPAPSEIGEAAQYAQLMMMMRRAEVSIQAHKENALSLRQL